MSDNGDRYDEFGYIPDDEVGGVAAAGGPSRAANRDVLTREPLPQDAMLDEGGDWPDPDDGRAGDGYYDDDLEGDYVVLPRATSGLRKLLVTFVALLAILGIVAAASVVWVTRQISPPGPQGTEVASFEIPEGATFTAVAEMLEEKKIIANAGVMGWYRQFVSIDPVRAGRYVGFRENSSLAETVEVLNAGPVPAQSVVVTIIPGSWLADALEQIQEAFPAISIDELALTLASGRVKSKYHPDPRAPWEGYLLPETYQFSEDATAEEILQKIVDEFDGTLDDLNYQNATAITGRSAADLVTIASMIERETGDPIEERAKIARVIFNRLEQKMTLGIDATILYGLGRRGNEQGLTTPELETDGPYNSRTRQGLPPTAISLPGTDSLEAAINPADGPWTFYVLENDDPRTHFFTDSFDEFKRVAAECRAKGMC